MGKPNFSQIIEQIAPHSTLRRAWQLKGGISADMTALEIQDPHGSIRRIIVRQPPRSALQRDPYAAENEYRLLMALKRKGVAVPAAIGFDRTGPVPYLVLDYIPGSPVFALPESPNFTHRLAAQLVKIHSLDFAHHELAFLPDSSRFVAERIAAQPLQVSDALGEERIQKKLQSAWPFAKHNPDVLLHGDYWPGNVLWHGDKLAAVIDWEDACWGDPLYDLAIARLDLLWIFGLETMNLFSESYQTSARIDAASLPYWDLYAALRFIRLAGSQLEEWAAYFHPYGRQDITAATIREHFQFFVAQAFQRLERR